MNAKDKAILAAISILAGLIGYKVVQDDPATTPPPVVVDSAPTSPAVPWVVGDSFAQYGDTKALQSTISTVAGGSGPPSTSRYTDGYSGSLALIDTTVRYHGHQTLKLAQPGGTASTPQLWVGLPKTYTHLWLRAVVRFSPGFTTTGTLANSANAYKLLGWSWTTYDGSGRLEITNTNQYDFYFDVLQNGSVVGGGNHTKAGNITTEWSDGQWYVYLVELDHSVKPGIARFYSARDGRTLVLRATVTGSMKSGTALPPFNRVAIGMNFNQVRAKTQSQAVWIGEWSVIDGATYTNALGL